MGVEGWAKIWYNMYLQFEKGFVLSWFICFWLGRAGKVPRRIRTWRTCAKGLGCL